MKVLVLNMPKDFNDGVAYLERHLGASFYYVKSTDHNSIDVSDYDLLIFFIIKFDEFLVELCNKAQTFKVYSLVVNTNHIEEGIVYKNLVSRLPSVEIVDKTISQEEMLNRIKKLIRLDQLESTENYVKVNAENLTKVNIAFCNIYLALSANKLIKLFNENDLYSDLEILKYVKKGIKDFYIKSEDYEKYSKAYSDNLNLVIRKSNDNDKFQLQIQGVEHIYSVAVKLGVTQEVIQDVNLVTGSLVEDLQKKNKDIFKLLDEARRVNNYLFGHGLLIAYVASSVLSSMLWNSASSIHKIVIVSILHDLSLGGDEFLEIADLDEKKIETMGWKIVKKVRNHPLDSAELIAKAKDLPPDVDKIILSHHERPDGTGYPKGLDSTTISPMACVFIIAEDFVHKIYGKEITPHLKEEILKDFIAKYSKGNFKLPLNGFLKFLAA